MLIRAWKPARILEIGTSNGYSTIWWADALVNPAQVLVKLEANPTKITQARDDFHLAGVADRIQVVPGACRWLPTPIQCGGMGSHFSRRQSHRICGLLAGSEARFEDGRSYNRG